MSTNVKTKKYDMLEKQNGVALLIHDFGDGNLTGEYSITLNGTCSVVKDGKRGTNLICQIVCLGSN